MSNNITTGRRRKRQRNYVTIENSMFEDNRLSWKAKGLLGYLLTKPDGWVVRIPDLVKHATDGEKAIRSAIKELKKYGYLTFQRVKKANGKWAGTVWEYDDIPMFDVEEAEEVEVAKKDAEETQTQESQGVEPYADFRHVENRQAENGTHISNKDISNKDFSNISSSRDSIESIDSKLKEKYPHAPFEDIKEQVLNDNSLTIETDKQYKSILEYRLKNWKPKTHRSKKKQPKPPTRTEILPEWFDDDNEYEQQDVQQPLTKESQKVIEQKKRELKETLKQLKKGDLN